MYNPPPHATNSQASMSSIEDGQVWRDTSAEHTYGSYLDSHESYHVRPTQVGGTRSSVVEANGTHHPDITVGLLDDDVKGKKKSFKGRKTVWPGVFFLFLLTVSALGAITYFGIESFKATQKAKEILEEQGIGPNGLPKPPKKLTPPKGMNDFFFFIHPSIHPSIHYGPQISTFFVWEKKVVDQ
jgi:hypothetical protein